MILIGIGHKARRGKDTVAQHLAGRVPGVRVYHFADALKEECRRAHIMYSEFACGAVPQLRIQGFPIREPEVIQRAGAWIKRAGILCYARGGVSTWRYDGMEGKDGELLQWYGTDFRRAADPLYWIKQLDRQLRREAPWCAFVADLRFRNEAEWIRHRGGWLWKVHRDQPLEATGRAADHPSEIDLDDWEDWDAVLDNSGKLEQLHAAATALWDGLQSWRPLSPI